MVHLMGSRCKADAAVRRAGRPRALGPWLRRVAVLRSPPSLRPFRTAGPAGPLYELRRGRERLDTAWNAELSRYDHIDSPTRRSRLVIRLGGEERGLHTRSDHRASSGRGWRPGFRLGTTVALR